MEEKTLAFVTIDFWTLIFTWANLIILFLLMKKFLFGPIQNIIKQREDEVASMYNTAEEAVNRATDMEAEYEKKLSGAKDEAEQIIKTATDNANIRSEKMIAETQQKVDSMMSKANERIEQEKQSALSEVKSEISSIAVSIASKVIEKEINEADYERLVNKCIDEMGDKA